MTATVASVHQAAQALLDTAENALATTSAGFDGGTWLSPGFPSFDGQCDFVCVWQGATNFAASGLIPASQTFRTGPRIDLITLNVTAGRCLQVNFPQGIPSAEAKTEDAVKVMEDGQALWNGIGAEIAAGDLFDGTCKQISLTGMTALTPEGGMGGWNLVCVVQIDGYPVSL